MPSCVCVSARRARARAADPRAGQGVGGLTAASACTRQGCGVDGGVADWPRCGYSGRRRGRRGARGAEALVRPLCSAPPPQPSSKEGGYYAAQLRVSARRSRRSAACTRISSVGEERAAMEARRELAHAVALREPWASCRGGSRGRPGVGGWRHHAPRREARRRSGARGRRGAAASLFRRAAHGADWSGGGGARARGVRRRASRDSGRRGSIATRGTVA